MRIIATYRPNVSVQLGGRLHHFDGLNTNRTDDGNTTLRMLGIIPPTTALTATPGAAGNVDEGVHSIYVTFVYILGGVVLVESNPSPIASATAAAGGSTIALTNIPVSTNTSVNGRRIYVTKAGGTTPLQIVTTVAEILDNTTTTYTYNTSDANLSSNAISTGNAVLPCSCYALSFGNRLITFGSIGKFNMIVFTNGSVNFTYMGGPILLDGDVGKQIILNDNFTSYTIATVNEAARTGTLTVAYTGTSSTSTLGDPVTIIGDPNLVTIGNPLPELIEGYDPLADAQFQVGQDDGMYLRGGMIMNQTILFGKDRAIYQLIGDIITDPTVGPSYRVDILTDKVGIASHWSCKSLPGGGGLFYGGDGIYFISGGNPVKVTDVLDPIFDETQESSILLGGEDCRVDHAYDELAHAIWNPITKRYLLWVARKANSTATRKALDLCIMLDFKKKNSRKQPSAWAFLIPAAMSLGSQDIIEKRFRMIIGTYHSKLLELFIGYRDGVPTISTGTTNFLFKVSAVTAATATSNVRLTFSSTAPYGGFADITGGAMGLPIVGVSGTNQGRFSVIKNFISSGIVEVDEELYGANPFAVNDIVSIGGYQALWTSNEEIFGARTIVKRGSKQKVNFNIPAFTSVDT